jgi:hypothetical protein
VLGPACGCACSSKLTSFDLVLQRGTPSAEPPRLDRPPLGCSSLVERGPESTKPLVCKTHLELDAVRAASRPGATLFVSANNASLPRWGLPPTHQAFDTSSNGGWRLTAAELERKWRAQRGPGWCVCSGVLPAQTGSVCVGFACGGICVLGVVIGEALQLWGRWWGKGGGAVF